MHVQEGWQSTSSCAQAHARLPCQLRLDSPAARTCSCSAPCKGYSAPDKTGGLAAAQVTGALTVRILEGPDSLIPLTMVARAGGRCTGCMATTPGVVKVSNMQFTERLSCCSVPHMCMLSSGQTSGINASLR